MKLTVAYTILFALAAHASPSWAAKPIDICNGPVTYIEFAVASGKYPTDPLVPDVTTKGVTVWDLNLHQTPDQLSSFCTANPGDQEVITLLPAHITTCKGVPQKGGKRTVLCQ